MQGRTISVVLIALLIAGCGGGDAPESDFDAVVQTVQAAAKAFAESDGDKTCSYLTENAQRQAQLQFGGGPLGSVDCPALVGRAAFVLSPEERERLKAVQPTNVQVNGDSASASVAAQSVSVQLNLQKSGDDWKISGFANAQGG